MGAALDQSGAKRKRFAAALQARQLRTAFLLRPRSWGDPRQADHRPAQAIIHATRELFYRDINLHA